jgi:hypothetical protein
MQRIIPHDGKNWGSNVGEFQLNLMQVLFLFQIMTLCQTYLSKLGHP